MKNRSQETPEDKTIGRTISARLRDSSRSPVGKCLDTETLAAFFDRTLTRSEQAAHEDHILSCLQCQEYLAELARLGDVDEPPALLEGETAPEEGKAKRGGYLGFAWAAPLLVFLVFIGIWFREDLERFWRGNEETAQNAGPPAASSGDAAKLAKGRAAETPKPPAGGKAAEGKKQTASLSEPSPVSPPAEARAGAPAVAITGATTANEAGGAGGAINPSREHAALSAASKPADRVLDYSAGELQPANRAVTAPTAAPSTESPGVTTGADRARAGASRLSGVTVRGFARRFSARWHVSRQGVIQKADEDGRWVSVPSGVRDDLFDITFAGDTAGWIVGHEGTVLRSTDGGASWQKVSSPTLEDLVRVSAVSDQQAKVMSRSGKTFTTIDGGKSWK